MDKAAKHNHVLVMSTVCISLMLWVPIAYAASYTRYIYLLPKFRTPITLVFAGLCISVFTAAVTASRRSRWAWVGAINSLLVFVFVLGRLRGLFN